MVITTYGYGGRFDGPLCSQGYGNSIPQVVDCEGSIRASISKDIKIKVEIMKDG